MRKLVNVTTLSSFVCYSGRRCSKKTQRLHFLSTRRGFLRLPLFTQTIFMYNNPTNEAGNASNDTRETGNDQKENMQSSGTNRDQTRSFGQVELWRLRRSAKSFRIHGRIPRV
jgi:hypothetical protein